MAFPTISNRDTATSKPAATHNKATSDFSKLTQQASSGEAVRTTDDDGKNAYVKTGKSKVQSRGERDQEQGGQKHGDKRSRNVDGERITFANGHVISRERIASNSDASVTAYLQDAGQKSGLNSSETGQTSGQSTGFESLRDLGQTQFTAGSADVAMAGLLHARSLRQGEVSNRFGTSSSADFGTTGITSHLSSEAAICGQQNSRGSSGGGNQRSGGGGSDKNSNSSNQNGGDDQNNNGVGGGGNIGPNAPGGSAEEPDDINFNAFQRVARLAVISEANDKGLDPSHAMRFYTLDPAVRAALRDFITENPSSKFSELCLNSLDNLAKLLPAHEQVSDVIFELLCRIRRNASGGQWRAADPFKLFATTQDLFERQSLDSRNATNLLATIDMLMLPPSSPDMLRKISSTLQSVAMSEHPLNVLELLGAAEDLTDSQLSYQGSVESRKINIPSASQQAAVPRVLREAAIREGQEMGLDPLASFQYSMTELGLRPVLRQFMNENPNTKLGALDIHCLNNIAAMIRVDCPTAESMLPFLRQIVENTGKNENWRGSDFLKLLSTTQDLWEGQDPANRNSHTLLAIANALTAPPASPSRLKEIGEALQRPEFSDPEFDCPAGINAFIETLLKSSGLANLSSEKQIAHIAQPAPDSALRYMMQYFLAETPDARFTVKSMDSVFRLSMLLLDSEGASETMLSLLRNLRMNSTDVMNWLSPELLPTVMSATHEHFEPLASHERLAETLLMLVQVLTGEKLFE